MTELNNLENYKKSKLTIDITKANIIGIVMLIPITLIYGVLFYLINDTDLILSNFKSSFKNIDSSFGEFGIPLIFLLTTLFGIIIHELIHGITWALFAKKGFKSIKFGVLWKLMTPYCHCKEPLLLKHYILGAIMPAIILGFLPAIYSIITGNIWLLIFAIFFTLAAIGDFLVIKLIRKEKNDSLVQDHPSEAGCYIYHIDN
jgi:hypothetical protein